MKSPLAAGPASPLRRFAPYLQPHRRQIALAFALVLLVSALQVVFPALIGRMVDELVHPTTSPGAWSGMGFLLGAFGAALAARTGFLLWRNFLVQQIGMRVTCDMRVRLFAHLQTLGLRFYENRQTGRIVSRITDDAGALNSLISGATVTLAGDVAAIAGVVVVLLATNVPLALLTFLLLPAFVGNYRWHRRRMRVDSRRHRHNWDRVVGFLHERIANSTLVKAFATEEREVARFRDRIERDYVNYNRVVWRDSLLGVGAEALGGLGTWLVLAAGAWLVGRRGGAAFTVGDLVAFYSYLGLLYSPILRIFQANATIQRATTAAEQIFALLDSPPHIPDNHALPAMPRARGEVEFSRVRFGYRPGREVLQDVSFRVAPGEMVALVGPSGSGKSTLAALLARFYDPTSGAVRVDGADIRGFNVQTWRQQVGIVMQDNILFSGTVAENIRYGRPEATDAEMVAAARAANAHDFIAAFPAGYGSRVGERGVQLSGGQRQRLAIARVILKDPRVLIFDEATSALDTHSERLVQEAVERLTRDRTTLVIAHRLSTVVNADRILVVQNGRLAQQGTHAELLREPGPYRELYELQFAARTGVAVAA